MKKSFLAVMVCLLAKGAWAQSSPSPRPSPTPRRQTSTAKQGHKVKLKSLGYKNPALHGTKKKKLVPQGDPGYMPGNTNDANSVLNHPP